MSKQPPKSDPLERLCARLGAVDGERLRRWLSRLLGEDAKQVPAGRRKVKKQKHAA